MKFTINYEVKYIQDNFFSRISYHAVYGNSILEALEFARFNGFSGIQIAVETPHLSFERLNSRAIGQIKEYAEVNGIGISIHCPDESVSLFENSIYLRAGIFKYFEALFDFIKNISKVKQVHLHDMNIKGKSHRIIGTGVIDFKRYISLLKDVDVLDYCIEVRPGELAKESLDILKRLFSD